MNLTMLTIELTLKWLSFIWTQQLVNRICVSMSSHPPASLFLPLPRRQFYFNHAYEILICFFETNCTLCAIALHARLYRKPWIQFRFNYQLILFKYKNNWKWKRIMNFSIIPSIHSSGNWNLTFVICNVIVIF